MTGSQIQDALEAIKTDLQTTQKGKTVDIMLRNSDGSSEVFTLSSDGAGTVNAGQLSLIQSFIDGLKPVADSYDAEYQTVKSTGQTFRTKRYAHIGLINAANQARNDLADALEADAEYQTAKTAYDQARVDADYVAARDAYKDGNLSENYGNLKDARGNYYEAN